jgi:hypothetical protein
MVSGRAILFFDRSSGSRQARPKVRHRQASCRKLRTHVRVAQQLPFVEEVTKKVAGRTFTRKSWIRARHQVRFCVAVSSSGLAPATAVVVPTEEDTIAAIPVKSVLDAAPIRLSRSIAGASTGSCHARSLETSFIREFNIARTPDLLGSQFRLKKRQAMQLPAASAEESVDASLSGNVVNAQQYLREHLAPYSHSKWSESAQHSGLRLVQKRKIASASESVT